MMQDRNSAFPAVDVRQRQRRQWIVIAVFALLAAGLPLLELVEHSGQNAIFSRDGLRDLGAACGMAAAILVSFQFIIGARLRLLDRIFPLNRQFIFHRFFGGTAALCALMHPLVMFGPDLIEGNFNDLLCWPVFVGAAALAGLWGAGLAALFRQRLKIPFHRWLVMHRLGTLGLALFILVHFSFAEGHFEVGMVHAVLIAALSIYGLSFLLNRGVLYRVTAKQAVGRDTLAFDLAPFTGAGLSHVPGQFVLAAFQAKGLPREEHPWTVSSPPFPDRKLQLTLKKSGDFTARLDVVEVGDRVRIRGPYGAFGPCFQETDAATTNLIMIAGGVGITPFLSLLRCFAQNSDSRKLVLIWSNKTEADILWKDEFERFQKTLPGFTVHHVLTREPSRTGVSGHISADRLKTFLPDAGSPYQVFICGPGQMMTDIQAQLAELGIDASRIFCERFQI